MVIHPHTHTKGAAMSSTTPRLPAVDPAHATGRAKEVFEGPLKGKTFNIFRSMASAPVLLDMYLGIAGAMGKASLSHKEQEVIQLAVAEANNCEYCASAHTVIGKGAGLTDAQTIEARRGTMMDAKLNALAKFALAIHEKKGFVTDADIASFKKAGYTDQHMGEVVGSYIQMMFTSTFNHMNNTPVDFPLVQKI
jgi:AhpD family alkylhydroperoxidase